MPTAIAMTKKNNTLTSVTTPSDTPLISPAQSSMNLYPQVVGSTCPAVNARMTMPMMSSSTAAVTIVAPTLPCSLPSSRSTDTVMPTDVAVRMTPKNSLCLNSSPGIINDTPSPAASGTITPREVIKRDAAPLRLSSLKFVSSPAENMIMTTPISANGLSSCLSDTRPVTPMMIPASNEPSTCGSPILRTRMSSSLLSSKTIAKCRKTE